MRDSHIIEGLRALAVEVDSLVADPDNARRHSRKNIDAIKASFAQFGQVKPIAVRRSDRVILAGNGRLVAAQELGWGVIAAVMMDGTDEQLRAFALADNKTSDLAEWDDLKLAETMAELHAADFDVASLGFSEKELADMIDASAADLPVEVYDGEAGQQPAPRAEDTQGEALDEAPPGTGRPGPEREARPAKAKKVPLVALTPTAGQLDALRAAAEEMRIYAGEPALTDMEALVKIAERFTKARRRKREEQSDG